MTEYSRITAIHFVFTRCPLYPEAHSYLNSIYSSTLPDHQKIYVDPDTQTEIKPNSQLLETVRDILTTECIGPDALDTTDEAAIRPLINKCTLSVNVGNQFPIRRLTKANLEAAFEFAITNNRLNDIRLSIGIHGLHFRPGLNYLNWGTDIVDDPSGFPSAPPGSPSAAGVPPALATPSTADIAAAVASAVTTAMAAVPAPTLPTLVRKAKMLFNPASLPSEVRKHYKDKVNGRLLTTRIHTPYRTPDAYDNMRYWSSGQLDMTIFADGTVLFHVPIDEKVVLKNLVPCKKDTHAGIRRWYDTISEYLRNLGVYVHPFWLFRKNHGGDWGFSIGDTMMDDVPTNMRMTCFHSNVLIFQILSQPAMFPPDSRLHDLVAQC